MQCGHSMECPSLVKVTLLSSQLIALASSLRLSTLPSSSYTQMGVSVWETSQTY